MNCRYCNKNLDKGDVYDVLKVHPLYAHMSEKELLKMARSYGWSPQHREHFLAIVTIQPDRGEQFDICSFCNGIEPLNEKAPRKIYEDSESHSSSK